MKINILTGERPTGKLHIGHYVGSLRERVRMQDEMDYENFFIMIADTQALTDNYGNPQKIRNNILEVMLDYLSIGLNPDKITFFVQSYVKGLTELTCYFMNMVTLPRLLRNPTVKNEIKQRGYDETQGVPVGFVNYPISQAADILGFMANVVPVGDDQLPMLEQAKEIAKSFNNTYEDIFPIPEPLLPKNKVCARLPGIDGNAKMSKSLNNGIFLSDDSLTLKTKINQMYTDPNHIKVSDPGQVKGNVVFTYLDAFCENKHFEKYLPEYNNLDELKEHYKKGGLGDIKVKTFLFNVMEEILAPFRERRKFYEDNIETVYDILKTGTNRANAYMNKTLEKVRSAIGIDYFEDTNFLNEFKNKNR